jgi:hypothetical protein
MRMTMARTYTVTTYDAGSVTVATLTMSPEMERIHDEIIAFDAANPGFWCKCDEPAPGCTEARGHSVDVFCANCGGCIQVG